MVIESSCDEGRSGSGLILWRNRVRGLVGKRARARLAICPFSASVSAQGGKVSSLSFKGAKERS
jgi:hypothetical protein